MLLNVYNNSKVMVHKRSFFTVMKIHKKKSSGNKNLLNLILQRDFFFFFYEHSQKGNKYLNASTLYKNGELGPHIEKVFSIGSQILQ